MYFGFDRISISYGQKKILSDVTMEFARGSISSILGPNGSGKSSLLKTVSRTLRPFSGSVILEDKPLREYAPRTLARKIAYLPQLHPRLRDMDVQTLVACGRYPYREFGSNARATDARIIRDALKVTGLEGSGARALSKLSGGERQRAWLAMCICQQPEILLLDEPTTHLDIGYQLEMLELVEKLRRERGITIVMVLHDLNLAARYSDKLYVLKEQRVLAEGTPEAIMNQSLLKDAFDVDGQIIWDEKNGCPFVIPEKR